MTKCKILAKNKANTIFDALVYPGKAPKCQSLPIEVFAGLDMEIGDAFYISTTVRQGSLTQTIIPNDGGILDSDFEVEGMDKLIKMIEPCSEK